VPVAEVRHAFTHFRLRARVWQVLLQGDALPPAPAGYLWLLLSEVEGAPLPRPVKTLLAGLGHGPP
jgi:adenine-specific DNA glycosylase